MKTVRLLTLIFSTAFVTTAAAQTKEALFSRDSAVLREEIIARSRADQKYRKRKKTADNPLQAEIDSANTLRMIEIINMYGFPSMHRFGKQKSKLLPHLILVHAPLSYADTLKQLLLVERQANRISPNEYAHVMWHLNGRKDVPQFEGAKVYKTRKRTTVRFEGF